MTGSLFIDGNEESSLNGKTLAIQNGFPEPKTAATNYLVGKGFTSGSYIKVTGGDGYLGNTPVFFMTGASAAAEPTGHSITASGGPRALAPEAGVARKKPSGKAAAKTSKKKTAAARAKDQNNKSDSDRDKGRRKKKSKDDN